MNAELVTKNPETIACMPVKALKFVRTADVPVRPERLVEPIQSHAPARAILFPMLIMYVHARPIKSVPVTTNANVRILSHSGTAENVFVLTARRQVLTRQHVPVMETKL